jgi:ankyrin repeat protein
MGASATGRDAIISALIGAGVDVNARTNVRGLAGCDISCRRPSSCLILYPVFCRALPMFTTPSAFFFVQTGDTALYLARKYGHVDAVALLEAAGAVSSPSPLKGSPSNRTVQHSNPGSPGGYSPSTQSARSLDGFARSRSALSPNIAAVAV